MATEPTPEQVAAQKAAAEKAAAEKAAAEKAAAEKADAGKPGIKLGDRVRMRAVHGLIIHPFTDPPTEIRTDSTGKLDVDSWVLMQFEAGKLALVSDD